MKEYCEGCVLEKQEQGEEDDEEEDKDEEEEEEEVEEEKGIECVHDNCIGDKTGGLAILPIALTCIGTVERGSFSEDFKFKFKFKYTRVSQPYKSGTLDSISFSNSRFSSWIF